MHDAVEGLGGKFWRSLRGMRLICFSVHDYVKARRNHVEAIYWQYYPEEPPAYQAASFDKLRLFFWQRRPQPNWRSLCAKIPMTQFESIHLHEALDPGLGEFLAPIESEIKAYNITRSTWFEDSADYIKKLSEHNVFVSPREVEGIGMALLEAQGAGMVCIANNAPTMNEYIIDGVNGYLLNKSNDCEFIEIVDPERVSRFARHYFFKGSANSQKQIPGIVEYLARPSAPAHHNIYTPIKDVARTLMWSKRREWAELQSLGAAFAFTRNNAEQTPVVSIVTVVRNNVSGLVRTLRSVFEQTYRNVEYIVMDGESTDGTLELLNLCKAGINRMVSQSDKGPYDAMNKSLEYCRGRYVIFMNSGDEFSEPHALDFAMQDAPLDADILCGHHFYVKAAHKFEARTARDLHGTYRNLVAGRFDMPWLSGIPCHQSTLTSVQLLRARPYDWQTFKIAADHDALFNAMASGAVAYNTNTYISKYYRGGISSTSARLCTQNWRDIALKHCQKPEAVERFYGNL